MEPHYQLEKQRHRTKHRAYEAVFLALKEALAGGEVTRAQLARKLDKDPATITRILSGPSNWTLNTVSDLLFAIDAEMNFTVHHFRDDRTTNEHHDMAVERAAPSIISEFSAPARNAEARNPRLISWVPTVDLQTGTRGAMQPK